MKPTRRRFLSGTAVATVLATGCVGRGGPGGGDGTVISADGEYDSVPALTGYEVSDAAVRPSVERPDDRDSWGLFVASREAADEYFGDSDEADESDAEAVRAFVDETDFDAGDRLLYVEAYAPQTCYELRLEGEPRIAENGLPLVAVRVDRTEPDDAPCGDAVTLVHLLVRLSFDLDAGPTDVVEVRVLTDDGETVDERRVEADARRGGDHSADPVTSHGGASIADASSSGSSAVDALPARCDGPV